MTKDIKINNILRMLIIALSALFLLTACSGDEKASTNDQSAVGAGEDSSQIAKKQNECWISEIVTMVYDAMGRASMKMYDKITEGSLSMMMIAFAVWLSFRLLEHVSSVKEVNPNEFWTEVLRKLGVCFVCGFLASSKAGLLFTLNTIIFPIYNAFLEFGAAILNAAVNDIAPSDIEEFFVPDQKFDRSVICEVTGDPNIALDDPNPSFPNAPKNMMQCLICSVWEQLNFGYVLAYESMKVAQVMGFIVGLLVIASFTIVKIGFVFYLVDAVFKLAMMMVLLPLLIMSFAFKATKGYARKGFFIMLTSSAFMMFISIVISMTLMAMNELVGPRADDFRPSKGVDREVYDILVANENNLERALKDLKSMQNKEYRMTSWNAANSTSGASDMWDRHEERKKRLDEAIQRQHERLTELVEAQGQAKLPMGSVSTTEISVTILCIVLICFLVVSSIGVAQEVTGSMIGEKISTKFQEKVKVLGHLILGLVSGGATSVLSKMKMARKVKEKKDAVKNKINSWRGK